MADPQYYFAEKDARRIKNVVGRVERGFVGGPPGSNNFMSGWFPQLKLAQSGAGGISGMSGTAPGSASVTVYTFDGSNLSSTSETETAYNLSSTAVGATKWLILAFILGYWFVIFEDCT